MKNNKRIYLDYCNIRPVTLVFTNPKSHHLLCKIKKKPTFPRFAHLVEIHKKPALSFFLGKKNPKQFTLCFTLSSQFYLFFSFFESFNHKYHKIKKKSLKYKNNPIHKYTNYSKKKEKCFLFFNE